MQSSKDKCNLPVYKVFQLSNIKITININMNIIQPHSLLLVI